MSQVRCPKCSLRLPHIKLSKVHCPVCGTLVELPHAEGERAEERQADSTPYFEPPERHSFLENLGLFALFLAACYVYIRMEVDHIETPNLPKVPTLQFPRLPERITHPDASPDECARVRAIGGECASYSTVRTCDDAGVMTEELCGLGAWPCVRDGCGPGVRCCVPGTFDATVTMGAE